MGLGPGFRGGNGGASSWADVEAFCRRIMVAMAVAERVTRKKEKVDTHIQLLNSEGSKAHVPQLGNSEVAGSNIPAAANTL